MLRVAKGEPKLQLSGKDEGLGLKCREGYRMRYMDCVCCTVSEGFLYCSDRYGEEQ